MIISQLTADKITSNTEKAFSLYESSRFGERVSGIIEYSPIESLFLMYENKMALFSGKKQITFSAILKKIKKHDKKIETKLAVFSNLRKKGYILKSALKFGAEFRVYEKGTFPEQAHARWLLFTSKESDILTWHDFSAKNRIAHSTKKNLLLAIVDNENDVSYYEVSWLRP